MPSSKPLTIFFSAGEPSGDLHGANLIRQLQARSGDVRAVGYGGPLMAAAGCDLHADLTALAVMWFARALMNLHKFWALASRADRYFRHQRPDAVVLIDYPGFNWWIARRAKAHGIPVFYYAPPQVWAWAQWRVKKMRRLVDHVLCSLPFEQEWFARHGCNATFVGHPYFDEVRRQQFDARFLAEHGRREGPLVTILPGSRTQEVTHNLRWFLAAAKRIRQAVPNVRFAVAAFRSQHAELARQAIADQGLSIEVFVGKTPELIRLADCCMAVSGSVSLELLYQTKPTVILYWISRPAYFVQGLFRKVKYITLVNLLSTGELPPLWRTGAGRATERARDEGPGDGKRKEQGTRGRGPGAGERGTEESATVGEKVLFPEYLTCEDRSGELASHVVEWLRDRSKRQTLVEALRNLKAEVAAGGASSRAAEYVLEELGRADGIRGHSTSSLLTMRAAWTVHRRGLSAAMEK